MLQISIAASELETQRLMKILKKTRVEYALKLFFPSGIFPSFGRYHDRKTVGKVSHTKVKTSKQIYKWNMEYLPNASLI